MFTNRLLKKTKCGIMIKGNIKTSVLRNFQNEVLKKDIVTLPGINTILNVGALPTDGDKEGALYIDYFNNKEYYTLDKNRDINSPFHFSIDLHNMVSVDKTFDLILNMSTLEHVENPFMVSINLQKLLNPKGYIFIAVPFFFPIPSDKQRNIVI